MMSNEEEEVVVNDPTTGVDKASDSSSSDDLKKPSASSKGKGYQAPPGQERDYHPDDRLEIYPMRFVRVPMPGGGELYFNWLTSIFGFACLWGLSIWCMAKPEAASAELSHWKSVVDLNFTWFYIVANPVFTFYIVYLCIRYGNVKLGKKDEEPEFSDLSYFAMLFSAGVAVGLFFYGVSEPLSHQNSHWFANAGYHTQDEVDQFAMMITMYHWGFAAWSPYLIVGIAAGIGAYRFDLPLNVRATLFELLGPYTWGWIGDFVDGFSIVMTVAGICTSLGLGAMQLLAGFQRLGWVDEDLSEDQMTNVNIGIIWAITAVATISVVSGLQVGIKFLSQLGFNLGMVILCLVFFMENTKFLLNLLVQTTGYYFQWCLLQIPFWTDAFAGLRPGEGHAVDGNAAEIWWMGGWTVFYMAWWTAWGAFVGLFIARISRGRTIRQVVVYSFIAPLLYAMLWFCVFGGVGLRQARQGLELEVLGAEYYNDSAHFRVDGSEVCYNVPQENVYVGDELVFENHMPGITPVCQYDTADSTSAWFNVMYSFTYPDDSNDFGGFGGFLSVLSVIAISIYFVTSSDSGSLVVDHLSANGHEEHHWLQRVFWACTEGAVATALLTAGGSDALGALQAASIVFGLPFNLFIFLMMVSIHKMCHYSEIEDDETKDDSHLPNPKSFHTPIYGGVFNVMEWIASFGQVHPDRVELGMDKPSAMQTVEFFIGLFLPFWSFYRVLEKLNDQYSPFWRIFLTAIYCLQFLAWVAMFACGAINVGFVCIGWTILLMNACILATVRMSVRETFGLDGNIIADFISSAFLYPQVFCQMIIEFEEGESMPQEVLEHVGQHEEADTPKEIMA